ncbi:hypothetical protein [Prochlorococcus sp. MIT 1223]|uniref:hypothetical protein n=1 Tax=Prochlorococcus sp. MIT 1223 TaxID=3096217 RepID=UPI002A762E7B|nr:hypothetical protein [Prochlorococcus sp. MIT 1223]
MSYEAGSRECRSLIEAKENLIKGMQSLSAIKNTEHIQTQLKALYNELEEMHETRRKIEKEE